MPSRIDPRSPVAIRIRPRAERDLLAAARAEALRAGPPAGHALLAACGRALLRLAVPQAAAPARAACGIPEVEWIAVDGLPLYWAVLRAPDRIDAIRLLVLGPP